MANANQRAKISHPARISERNWSHSDWRSHLSTVSLDEISQVHFFPLGQVSELKSAKPPVLPETSIKVIFLLYMFRIVTPSTSQLILFWEDFDDILTDVTT